MSKVVVFADSPTFRTRQKIGPDEDQRRRDQTAHQTNRIVWADWVVGLGGVVLVDEGVAIGVEMPLAGLVQLTNKIEAMSDGLDARAYVGVAHDLGKARRACEYAGKRGVRTPVMWSPKIDSELEPLEKGEDMKAVAPTPAKAEGSEHSDGEAARAMADERSGEPPPPEMTHAGADMQARARQLHNLAATDKKDPGQDPDAIKKQVAAVLGSIRQQAPQIAQLKTAAPDIYKSIQRLIQGVVAMARTLDSGEPIQKHEEEILQKAIKGLKSGLPLGEADPPGVFGRAVDRPVFALNHETKGEVARFRSLAELRAAAAKAGPGHTTEFRPTGGKLDFKVFDYTHLLPPHLDRRRHRLMLYHEHDAATGRGEMRAHFWERVTPTPDRAEAQRKVTQSIGAPEWPGATSRGHVWADQNKKYAVIDTSSLHESFRGKGVGAAMYEAVLHHAHLHGAERVRGNQHSTLAHAMHQKLSEKHGMEYEAPRIGPSTDGGVVDGAFGQYDYMIKDALPMPKAPVEHHLDLPAGSVHQGGPGAARNNVGKVKVAHGNGKESWIQARAGQIPATVDRHAQPILGHNAHPISARNPKGH